MFSIQSHPDKRAAVKATMFMDHVKGNHVVVLVNDQWSSGKLGRGNAPSNFYPGLFLNRQDPKV